MLSMTAPATAIDFWSDEVLADPYPHYRAMRDEGPLVWLQSVGAWGAFRYAPIRAILGNPVVFSSANGVMLNDAMNLATSDPGVMLCTDDPRHRAMRRVFSRPLTPGAVASLRDRLTAVIDDHLPQLVERRSFDAVADFAQILPLSVVSELVGLSEEGRENMLVWAAGTFNAFGPDYAPRTRSGLEIVGVAFDYISKVPRAALDPAGWGAALFAAVDQGEIDTQDARSMLGDYLVPALDTTISALSGAVLMFGENPDQWTLLRGDPTLMSDAIDEIVRLQSPIRGFGRQASTDHELDGVGIRAGDRIQVFYASGNRDERHYPDPDRFLITRRAKDHVGFGYGHHLCAGMHLAKLEIAIALQALAERVKTISIDGVSRSLHNTLNVIDRLEVTITPA